MLQIKMFIQTSFDSSNGTQYTTWLINVKSLFQALCFTTKNSKQDFPLSPSSPLKFTRKDLCQGLFFNKKTGLQLGTFIKKRLWHRCFPMNATKFLKAAFLQNTFRQPLLIFLTQQLSLPLISILHYTFIFDNFGETKQEYWSFAVDFSMNSF